MTKIVWDEVGKRFFEGGVRHGVLYPRNASGLYPKGVPWNGLTGVTESPSGAEASPQYADDIKYFNFMSTEEFGATIEAFMYPDEFKPCNGMATIATGVTIGQQKRSVFGMCYRTAIGNDVDDIDHGYKLHLIYGAQASPSEVAYKSINDQPEASTMSWEVTTTPVSVTGFRPTASVVVDSTTTPAEKMAALELILYGADAIVEPATPAVDPRLPLPDEVATIIGTVAG